MLQPSRVLWEHHWSSGVGMRLEGWCSQSTPRLVPGPGGLTRPRVGRIYILWVGAPSPGIIWLASGKTLKSQKISAILSRVRWAAVVVWHNRGVTRERATGRGSASMGLVGRERDGGGGPREVRPFTFPGLFSKEDVSCYVDSDAASPWLSCWW